MNALLHGLPITSVLNCAIDLYRNLELDDDELLEIVRNLVIIGSKWLWIFKKLTLTLAPVFLNLLCRLSKTSVIRSNFIKRLKTGQRRRRRKGAQNPNRMVSTCQSHLRLPRIRPHPVLVALKTPGIVLIPVWTRPSCSLKSRI